MAFNFRTERWRLHYLGNNTPGYHPHRFFRCLNDWDKFNFLELTGLQEWRKKLRSSLHPVLFALIYHVASLASNALSLPPELHSNLLLAAPKIVQAVSAASCDYFTWRLAQKIYARDDRAAWTTVCIWPNSY
jgi:GPI mannosyltransferase 3